MVKKLFFLSVLLLSSSCSAKWIKLLISGIGAGFAYDAAKTVSPAKMNELHGRLKKMGTTLIDTAPRVWPQKITLEAHEIGADIHNNEKFYGYTALSAALGLFCIVTLIG